MMIPLRNYKTWLESGDSISRSEKRCLLKSISFTARSSRRCKNVPSQNNIDVLHLEFHWNIQANIDIDHFEHEIMESTRYFSGLDRPILSLLAMNSRRRFSTIPNEICTSVGYLLLAFVNIMHSKDISEHHKITHLVNTFSKSKFQRIIGDHFFLSCFVGEHAAAANHQRINTTRTNVKDCQINAKAAKMSSKHSTI